MSQTHAIDRAFDGIDPKPFIHQSPDGVQSLHLMVDGIRCAGCMRSIEKTLAAYEQLKEGRVNMTSKRMVMRWQDGSFDPSVVMRDIVNKGFDLAPFDPETMSNSDKEEETRLLYAMAVAGFAMANVMMLSFAVWAGAFATMGEGTRGLFHWLSAIVALPTVVYSGRPFFGSAIKALSNKQLNMDVPISLAIVLASGMSLFETIEGGDHVYFDASVSLLFFLLVGRYLDHRARAKARSVGENLVALQAMTADVVMDDGSIEALPIHQVALGTVVRVKKGDKIPVDGVVLAGLSDIDTSMVTGESVPMSAKAGDQLYTGMINLSATLEIKVTAVGDSTLLADIVRMMENAEQARGQFVRLADKIAGWYAPVVHLLGLLTFLGWWLGMGADWQQALLLAIAVLIITCPCALGLAVPVVQVVASGRLMRQGVLLKSGDALEKLKNVNTICFDKTGTLTLGKPALVNRHLLSDDLLSLCAGMAYSSSHPLSRAIVEAFPTAKPLDQVKEISGCGLEWQDGDDHYRLGNRQWLDVPALQQGHEAGPELWFEKNGSVLHCLKFVDQLRPDALETVQWIKEQGYRVVLLSGDHYGSVKAQANALGVDDFWASLKPTEKVAKIDELKEKAKLANGCVLMVGDGLNDAPALAAADVSVSPASAADISQTASDIIFQGKSLAVVPEILTVSKKTDRLVKQNFALAFCYNIIAIPMAVAGLATPLVAAIAMSSSSLLVILNSLRLHLAKVKAS